MADTEVLDGLVEGLHARFATVSGIAVMLDAEPRSVQKTPLLYTLLDSGPRQPAGNLVEERWRFRSRLCIPWADPKAAEAQVRSYAAALPRAVDAGPRLGGRARDAFVDEVDAGWQVIDGNEYRVVDFYTVVKVYAPLGAGA